MDREIPVMHLIDDDVGRLDHRPRNDMGGLAEKAAEYMDEKSPKRSFELSSVLLNARTKSLTE